MGLDTSAVDQLRRALDEGSRTGVDKLDHLLQDFLQPRSGEGTRVVSLEDGTGNALSARVNADNNLGTEARFGRTSVVTGSVSVDTTSGICIAQRSGRLTFTMQNLDDTTPIHFEVGGAVATTNSLRLDPGQMYSLPPGVSAEGAVTCRTPAGVALLSFVEYVSAA